MSSRPLLSDVEDARPSLLSSAPLSNRQQRESESIRTLCLVILSVAVTGLGAYYLDTILVRFVLALALRFLLTPLIDLLSCHGREGPRFRGRRVRLPRGAAIVVSLVIAAGGLGVLGLVVVKSIGSFAAHADQYGARVTQLVEGAINATARLDLGLDLNPLTERNSSLQHALVDLATKHLSLSHLVLGLLGTVAHVAENLIYILLFLAFLLAGSKPRTLHTNGLARHNVHDAAEEQVFVYIRGKVLISALVALSDATILLSLRVNLWLVFGVLTFWLNFVPNVGMAIGVLLPMPLVLLDPAFGFVSCTVAFVAPLACGLVAKDVLEPLIIGHATSLTPLSVLLAVLLWGSIWGLTGMVLAVPLTAAIRIYLERLSHPLPRWVANTLAGKGDDDDDAAQVKPL